MIFIFIKLIFKYLFNNMANFSGLVQGMRISQASAGKGLIVEPQYAIVISLVYIGVVIILHMIGKFRKDNTVVPPPS